MVLGTAVVAYAAATRVVHVVSGTTVAIWAIIDGAIRAATAGATNLLSGVVAATSYVRRLSCISAPADVDDGGVMALDEGGAACPSPSNELDSTTRHLRSWADAPMLTGLSSR